MFCCLSPVHQHPVVHHPPLLLPLTAAQQVPVTPQVSTHVPGGGTRSKWASQLLTFPLPSILVSSLSKGEKGEEDEDEHESSMEVLDDDECGVDGIPQALVLLVLLPRAKI